MDDKKKVFNMEEAIRKQQARLDKRPEPDRSKEPDMRYTNELIKAHEEDEKKKGYKCRFCKAYNTISFQKGERVTLGENFPFMIFYRTCLSCGVTYTPNFCLRVLNSALKDLASKGVI